MPSAESHAESGFATLWDAGSTDDLVCTHNAGRSQIAQVFFERDAPPNLRTGEAEVVGADRAPTTNDSAILCSS